LKIFKLIFSFRTIFLILALIPVLALILITINLVAGSSTAIHIMGFKLFQTTFIASPEPPPVIPNLLHYGILPALWGTFLVVVLSIFIAFPVSLSFAILANDFSFGWMNTIIRGLIGFLSGIPPIIYAVMTSTFFLWFMWAKFAGKGLPLEQLPPPDLLPSNASCTLLGGIMLALLIIPFMTPLLDDVIQNVPGTLKEASLALGTNRWHTLKAVTIPYALPGIISALILGILTALGEAIIVAYAIGFGSTNLPQPLFDVLERTAPLTSTIAGLSAGGLTRSQIIGPIGHSVASFMGLLLLLIAFVLLGISFYFQRKLRKGLPQ
jgi:phosphate transport system permease protein